MKKLLFIAAALLCVAPLANIVCAQGVPAPYTPRLQTVFTGLSRPVMIKGPNDGTRRLFILQQSGIVRVVQPGSSTPTDFLN
ncbi:MAG TPA: hypothetical protein VK468_11370, partial [Pyrinomonadaceae bacterium]|nr:hypothetical protein [Pyrinomonadaceae bacterium]